MRTVLRVIDSISEWAGKSVSWFSVALILVVTYSVVMRYVFNKPANWPYDTGVMLGASLYILAFAYTQRHGDHVRVEVFYVHLPLRGKALIDVFGDIFAFLPLIILLTVASILWAWDAWSTGERISLSGWYPPAGPLRTVVALGFFLLAFQGLAQLVRDLYLLIKHKPYD